MNGLQIIDLKESTFMDKLMRREPRENAFLEINNLLATVPILKLDKESIDKRLSKYKITPEKARSRLVYFYTIILKHFVRDYDISDSEYERLRHLQHILSIDSKEIGSIHSAVLYPIYQHYVRQAVSDGQLSETEKLTLENLTNQLRIPKDFAVRIYNSEAEKILNSKLRETIKDGMLSETEEKELLKIADSLKIELRLTQDAKKNLQRHRYLWQLSIGNLPKLKTNIHLEKDEFCAAVLKVEIYEVGNVREAVKFSGYQSSNNFAPVGFHSGMIQTNRLPGEVMKFGAAGMLYFTNRRIIFNQVNGIFQIPFTNVIGATFYRNGMLLEQIKGRDKFIKFRGDIEAVKLIFNSLMTKSRE